MRYSENSAWNEDEIVSHPQPGKKEIQRRHGGDPNDEKPRRDHAPIVEDPCEIVSRQKKDRESETALAAVPVFPALQQNQHRDRRDAENLLHQVEDRIRGAVFRQDVVDRRREYPYHVGKQLKGVYDQARQGKSKLIIFRLSPS